MQAHTYHNRSALMHADKYSSSTMLRALHVRCLFSTFCAGRRVHGFTASFISWLHENLDYVCLLCLSFSLPVAVLECMVKQPMWSSSLDALLLNPYLLFRIKCDPFSHLRAVKSPYIHFFCQTFPNVPVLF